MTRRLVTGLGHCLRRDVTTQAHNVTTVTRNRSLPEPWSLILVTGRKDPLTCEFTSRSDHSDHRSKYYKTHVRAGSDKPPTRVVWSLTGFTRAVMAGSA